jgi:flagellar biosynthetic protein FlhB
MAEPRDDQERTEDPTALRRERAREEGQNPRSVDLSAAAMLLAGSLALGSSGGLTLTRGLEAVFRETGRYLVDANALDQASAVGLLRFVTREALTAAFPVLFAITACALVVNAIQARGTLSLTPLTPKWSHLDPSAGFKRIVGLDGAITMVKAVLKLTLLAGIASLVGRRAWPELMSLTSATPSDVLAVMGAVTLKAVNLTGLAFLAIAIADYVVQFRRHEQQLRMSRREVLDEFRQTDGDPMLKARIRSFARSLSRQRMLALIPTADVVVTNPTHVAVALRYDPLAQEAPVVVAMGERKLAERIKALARAARVPCVEDPPLARALLATGTVGQAIPSALYRAVAEVLAFVYRRRGGAPAAMSERTR